MLPIIPVDKANHMVYGGLAGLLGAALGGAAGALAAGAVVAAGKELVDLASNRRALARGAPPPHGVEWLDGAATLAGAAVPALAILLKGTIT
jgi:hypothetical protein